MYTKGGTMKQANTFRQGDLLIFETDVLPKEVKKQKTNVLVHSDTTGHTHAVKGGIVYADTTGKQYIEVKKEAEVLHEEHNKKRIILTKGVWQVRRQRQKTGKDMAKVVLD